MTRPIADISETTASTPAAPHHKQQDNPAETPYLRN
jgi:hypothetical protein